MPRGDGTDRHTGKGGLGTMTGCGIVVGVGGTGDSVSQRETLGWVEGTQPDRCPGQDALPA